MSIDLSQFHQVFFEESFEGLDAMEASLMELDPQEIDSETINTIFRAAHSIKGGSATFGFSVVADFTHILETLLDEVRSGTRGLSRDDIDLYLQSVDCLRDLLTALQDKEEPDTTQSDELKASFEAILNGDSVAEAELPEPAVNESVVQNTPVDSVASESVWSIRFIPGGDVLRTGNEPLRMFRELRDLGSLQISAICKNVPAFAEMDAENCYLGWDIVLTGNASEEAINEVFEWVVDESLIELSEVSGSSVSNWDIHFKPGEDVLRTGNEPLRIIRELAEYGTLTSVADVSCVPGWSEINSETCYLAWQLTLSDKATKEQIDEAFEWVVDEADLKITHSSQGVSVNSAESSVLAEQSVSPVVEAVTPITKPVVAEIVPPSVEPSSTAEPVKKAAVKKSSGESTSIRVGIDKIDSLINMVGELVITQSMLGQLGGEFEMSSLPKLIEGLGQLEQNTRELQESVMRIRMLPISFAFSRFPRMVRDLSRRLDKNINLILQGENTELDKTVMEKIGDPLVHLVRNSVDHGIEMPADRLAAGKSETGEILLNAYHQGGNVVIDITDDGKGLDKKRLVAKAIEKGLILERDALSMTDDQVHDLIFQPGFSTAKEVSDVSGRGVGMDVVRRNIQELNGTVEITSKEGQGSRITIRLPLTLAILDGQLVRVGTDVYIFPLVSIVESLQAKSEMLSHVAGGCDVFRLRDEYVPVIRLFDIFNIKADTEVLEDSLLVVVESEGEKVGILVDELEAQQQVVIKSLEQNYQRVEGVSGATILGDGTVALILDIPGLVKLAGVNHKIRTQVNSLSVTHQTQH
jgi:two-component system chemotaxis sensor kinase CheA